MLPAFELLRPRSLSEALEILEATPQALPIGGGTNLIVDIRSGKLCPEIVVDLSELEELCCIRRKAGVMHIGAAVTIAELLDDPMIEQTAPILTEMARSFANVLIRNRATVGGNLVNAAPCADTAPALLVLDAEIELVSLEGTRRVRLDEFLINAFETKRQPKELLTSVEFPVPSDSMVGRFEKMGLRKISCMAKVDVAVALTLDETGVCKQTRIAMGAASPIAVRAHEAEKTLDGRSPDAEAIDQAASLAASAIVPRAGSEYKRQVVHGLTRCLLTAAAEEARR